jgi:hypothetical protein
MIRFFLSYLFLLSSFSSSLAITLRVTWDPSPNKDLVGYRVYWGTTSKTYAQKSDVIQETTFDISDAQAGVRYYCSVTTIDLWGSESVFSKEVSVQAGDEEEPPQPQLPTTWSLEPGYPNPLPVGRLQSVQLAVPEEAFFTVELYNILGQKVRTLHNGAKTAGWYWLTWDGTDDQSQRLPAGIYYYHLHSTTHSLIQPVTLLH